MFIKMAKVIPAFMRLIYRLPSQFFGDGFLILCVFSAGLAYASGPLSESSGGSYYPPRLSGRTLAVIGMSNEVSNEAWLDARVGMGLRVILAQLFFDSGNFAMLEEKPGMRGKLNELASGIWALNEEGYDFHEDIKEARGLGADFIAYGKVYYFGKPKSKMSFGPMHMHRNAVVIKVEVTLEDLRGGNRIREKGTGQSVTNAASAIFEFREDNVELDKTNVGNATKEALSDAVEKVINKFKRAHH